MVIISPFRKFLKPVLLPFPGRTPQIRSAVRLCGLAKSAGRQAARARKGSKNSKAAPPGGVAVAVICGYAAAAA